MQFLFMNKHIFLFYPPSPCFHYSMTARTRKHFGNKRNKALISCPSVVSDDTNIHYGITQAVKFRLHATKDNIIREVQIFKSKKALNNKERVFKMKKFLVVMLMLMMLCVAGCDGKKAEGVCAAVILGEALGKPISDKSTYTLAREGTYVKVIRRGMSLYCTEVEGKITEITLLFNKFLNYEDAMSATLEKMAEYARDYNGDVYFGYSEKRFVTRYKGNNIVTAVVELNIEGYWTVAFTYQKLSKEGVLYIDYEPLYE